MSKCSHCGKQLQSLMVCSNCKNNWYCSRDCQKFDWPNHKSNCKKVGLISNDNRQCTILEVELNHIVNYIRTSHVNVFKLIFTLDPSEADKFKIRNSRYYSQHETDHSHKHTGCCGGISNTIYIPQSQMSSLQKAVNETVCRRGVRDHLDELLSYCHSKFKTITDKGRQEGLDIDQPTQKYLVNQTISEGCHSFFLNKIKQSLRSRSRMDAKQPMLMAIANTWYAKYPDRKLDFLSGISLKSLSEKGYAMQKGWLSDHSSSAQIIKQLEFFEKDGRFDEVTSQTATRNDRIMWWQPNLLPTPNLHKLLQKVYSIPFELTTKTSMVCVISESVQFSYFKDSEKAYHHMHTESNLADDAGVKFSVLVPMSKVSLTLKHITNKDIDEIVVEIEPGAMFIFKSRMFACGLTCHQNKTFLLRYWINGPVQEDC